MTHWNSVYPTFLMSLLFFFDNHLASLSSVLLNYHPFECFISKEMFTDSGFLTLAMWATFGLIAALIHAVVGTFPADMILLLICAFTPVIWIGRNEDIVQKIRSFWSEQDIQDEQPSFEGIWVGH